MLLLRYPVSCSDSMYVSRLPDRFTAVTVFYYRVICFCTFCYLLMRLRQMHIIAQTQCVSVVSCKSMSNAKCENICRNSVAQADRVCVFCR